MDPQTKTSTPPHPRMKKVNPFTSLASFPMNIRIHDQNGDEYMLLFIREHKIILFINVLIYSIVAFTPFIARWLFIWTDENILNNFFGMENLFRLYNDGWRIFLIMWFSFILTGFFNIFFKWFYNINTLTNQRFLDIDFISIFEIRVESATVKDIEDIKDTQNGILQSIFNMGDLTMLTASGGTEFNLDNVPKAHRIRDFIMDVAIQVKRRGGDND